MNNIVAKQVELHLLTFKDDAPKDSVMYVIYLLGLTEIYRQRFMVTWINLLLFLWLVVNVIAQVFGLWFVWLPLLSMVLAAGIYRRMIRE